MGFQRPEGGWRFNFGGMKTNTAADEMPPTKYPYAENVRYVQSLQTRSGYRRIFPDSGAGFGFTDIGSYSTLGTDNNPRLLGRTTANQILLDTNVQVGTLEGSSQGAFMIPFRPNQSPQSWMYIGSEDDYKKYSAPSASDNVQQYEVGIEEQQDPPDAAPNEFEVTNYFGPAVNWAQGGTAGAPSNGTRLSDTAGSIRQDPASGTGTDAYSSVQVASTKSYQVGMLLTVGGTIPSIVQQIYPALNGGVAVSIDSIFYFSGTTGRCVIVPTQGPTPTAFQSGSAIPSMSLYNPLSALRRGSLLYISGGSGAEVIFVLSVTNGPDGTICFETTTAANFIAGDTLTGTPAIGLSAVTSANSGQTLTSPDVTYTQTGAGIGTVSEGLASSPFTTIGTNNTTPQQYDYVGFGINISDLSQLVSVTFIFNVDPVVSYDTNAFYATLTPADIVAHPGPSGGGGGGGGGVLPANQFTQVLIPVNSLIRIGSDQGRTLSNCNGIQVKVETTGTVAIAIGSFYVGLGFQPDVGPTGSPYRYLVRTRNSLTGAVSNPSPETRYGVNPRRQSIRLTMQDTNSDIQDDIWDIFREGGSVNSFRYIGSIPNTGAIDVFTDNYFDTAALGGSVIEYDNFEPWPTIDVPFIATAGVVSGITTTIKVIGTVVLVIYSAAAPFTDLAPATISRWLPGTLMTIDSLNAYTLWNRPVAVTLASPPAANYYAYMLRIVENAGTATPGTLNINEPNVANQHLAYLWGPDAEGTVFGCGDPFRPGTVYFAKSFNPDSAPSEFNQEITDPSEPLMGGEVINGLALVSSTRRWWALYPNFGSGNRYQAVEAPVKRGLVAPFARCTDGQNIYFWARDGIWTTQGQSLTEDDLHNIFPHEGVPGRNYVYGGKTVYAPDYKYASQFRLAYRNSYLYADYRDSTGTPRTLVCDLRNPAVPAWCVDRYGAPITVHYAVPQQEGTLLSNTLNYPGLVLGSSNGQLYKQTDLNNDDSTPIPGVVATAEFNGGDVRSNELYNDQFIDLVPAAPAGVRATILDGGSAAQTAVVIPTAAVRTHTNVPIGLELSYMGVMIEWTDDFDQQSIPTLLRSWQPMFQSVPVSLNLWKNQGTTFGIEGYKHLRQILFAYKSTVPVTLTITVFDGVSPSPVTLPSTGGAYQKALFSLTFNKGMLYFITADCPDAEWQPYLSDTEFYVGAWDRAEPYRIVRDIATAIGVGEG